MIPGISTACFYPQNTEEALALLAGHGVRSSEVFLNSASELGSGYLRELRCIADGGGMQILSVHPFTSGMEPMLFFSMYQRRFEDGRDFYKRYYQAAAQLGAGIVVLHGNSAHHDIELSDYFERFAILLEDARKEGVRLCHENVCRCTGRSPDFFRELALALPHAGFVFDVKQAIRSGQDIFDFARAMGNNIAHIHLSDHDDAHDCLVPGHGTFNIKKLLMYLQTVGYDQGVTVEIYRDNYVEFVELIEGYQLLSQQISTI